VHKDIKKIAKKYMEQNGNEKISNKELLFYVISKFDTLENRVTKTETKQRMFMWAIPILIGVTAIVMR